MVSGNARFTGMVFRLFLLGCVLAACGGGGGSGSPSSPSVGPEGGTVSITDQGSSLGGARVYIPPGALEGEEAISLKAVPLPKALPAGYSAAGPCISFAPDGITFRQDASIYLPYGDKNNDGIVDGTGVPENKVRVLYYNPGTGAWEAMTVQDTDGEGNLVIARTGHFSTYLAAIDTGDATPLDPGTGTGSGALESGDCFVGTGNILDPASYSSLCFYYNLTVTRRATGMLALVDRYATYVVTGIPAIVSPEGDSATFDAASAFSKVRLSGDARLWNWEAEFVREHTRLRDYEVLDDELTEPGATEAGIRCRIEAVDENMVRISWGINVYEQITMVSLPNGGGNMMVIRFRASYR